MGVQSEIDRIKNNISAAYDAIEEMGGTLPDAANRNSAALAETVRGIPTGEGTVSGDISILALTSEEYNALTDDEKQANVQYMITDDNVVSGLSQGSSMNIYSEEERVIGTWIDGKPLYRIVFQGIAGNTDTFQTIANLSDLHVETVISCRGFYVTTNGYIAFPNTMGSSANDKSFFDIQTNDWTIRFKTTMANVVGQNVTTILEYTKTTD